MLRLIAPHTYKLNYAKTTPRWSVQHNHRILFIAILSPWIRAKKLWTIDTWRFHWACDNEMPLILRWITDMISMNKVPITIMQSMDLKSMSNFMVNSTVCHARVSCIFITSILLQSMVSSDSYCSLLIQMGHVSVLCKCNIGHGKLEMSVPSRSNRIPSNVVRWYITMHDLTSDFKFIGALLTLKTSRELKTLTDIKNV